MANIQFADESGESTFHLEEYVSREVLDSAGNFVSDYSNDQGPQELVLESGTHVILADYHTNVASSLEALSRKEGCRLYGTIALKKMTGIIQLSVDAMKYLSLLEVCGFMKKTLLWKKEGS